MLDLSVALLIALAGALIGATGIGGVLVVPVLYSLQGLPLPVAIACSALAFAAPGVYAMLMYWKQRKQHQPGQEAIPTRILVALLVGATVGAGLGAGLAHWLQAGWLLLLLAALCLQSGLRGLLRPAAASPSPHEARPASAGYAVAGGAVGLLSGLTGTGGPVVWVPLAQLWGQAPRLVLAGAQLIQLPIALTASLGHWSAGRLNLVWCLQLALLLLAGAMLGQRLARRLPVARVMAYANALLVGCGLWFFYRSWQTW